MSTSEAEILEAAICEKAQDEHIHGIRVDIKTIGNGEAVCLLNRSIYIWDMQDLKLITKETFQRV